MINMNSRLDKRLEIVENTFKKYSNRRKKNIQNSLIRPLYQEILKCIFIIIIIVFNTFLSLEILLILIFPANIIIFLLLLIILFYIEMRIYNKYWGLKGKWSIKK